MARIPLFVPTWSLLFSLSFLVLLLSQAPSTTALSPLSSSSSSSSSGMSFCRCACFGNSTYIPLFRPTTPSAPCLTCTRQFCLDQKLPQCIGAKGPKGDEDLDTATGEEGDVEARCFQRDSPKAHFIVVCFLVIVSTLLILAGLKHFGFDLSGTFNRSGVKGVVTEFAQFVSSIIQRRRIGQPMYSSMGS
ncbi:uncharacterized protein JCM6883_004060 [Sporobolomyces salmoneus]|uniref:uncharacterized protein n=1 Tax=Sporobolomyces salmoneus TaxID=183962 RepID=UPI0031732C22